MKIPVLFLCTYFVAANLHATTRYTDSIPINRHKISQEQFLNKYGKDDTAKAVINYFFKQRKKATKGIIPYSLIMAGGIILYATTIAGANVPTGIVVGGIVIFITGFLCNIAFRKCHRPCKILPEKTSQSS